MPRILIVTTAGQSVNGLYSRLGEHGFDCSFASEHLDAIERVREQAPDLVVLEINEYPAPDTAGLPQEIKKEKPLPVVALIDRRIIGRPDIIPEAIDDFIIGPGDAGELELRIKRLLKKVSDTDPGEIIRCGDLVIDLARCEVSISGQRIELTFKEYELLRFLAGHPGRVYTRDALLNKVWGYDYFGGDRTVDVHIRRLRSKIESLGRTFIDTVRNIGYRFNCNQ